MIINNIAIEIDGPDKAGKDILHKYIEQLSNYKYTLNSRGILTQLVYNDKFSRNNSYKLYYKPLIIFLTLSEIDHQIRCTLNNEPKINIKKDIEIYTKYAEYLEKNNIAKILKYDTSINTPFMIAKNIIEYLNSLKEEDFYLEKPIIIDSLNLYTNEDIKDEDIFYEGVN